jgi:hypothetical protein
MWRFTAINYLCRDMEQLHDVTRPGDWIRQDVSRSPGGDSEIFLNNCYGCHSGMDALAGAYAYLEWDPVQMRMLNSPGVVQAKYLINGNVFPFSHITTDNGWVNFWREGQLVAGGAPPTAASARAWARSVQARLLGLPGREVFKHVFHGPRTR